MRHCITRAIRIGKLCPKIGFYGLKFKESMRKE
jgi:hypothetical protein